MSAGYRALEPAPLLLDADGVPYSARYGDVYHARQGALAQARHVFLGGNELPQRWRNRTSFTVCEAGFGLGRNFLALWRAWRDDPERCARLHVLAFEAHPFAQDDLRAANQNLPEDVASLAAQLADAWPPLLPGMHRLEFEQGALTLTLAWGPIERMARQAQAGVDAYFLDGFSPARNPEMWSRELFGQWVRLARPGATAASWCVAGPVRRALRDAGFIVSRQPGYASKWHMLTARLRPHLGRGRPAQPQQAVVVVGAGPAGAAMAHGLAARGLDVTVVDPALARGPGGSHRGHLAAAITPLLARDDDYRARLSRAGVRRALHRWQALAPDARPWQCGTLQLAEDPEQARALQATLEALALPQAWAAWKEPAEASRLAGIALQRPGVYLADGQLARPERLLAALMDRPGVRQRAAQASRLEPAPGGGWLVHLNDAQAPLWASLVVLANAHQAWPLLQPLVPAGSLPKLAAGQRLAGQVSFFPASEYDPRLIVSGDGYWLPAQDGVNVAGGTYAVDARSSVVCADGHAEIAQKLRVLLSLAPQEGGPGAPQGGWAGWRAVVGGRLPVMGPVMQAPGLWLACGYGSRGLSWAALAADLLGAWIDGEPQPLERELSDALVPR